MKRNYVLLLVSVLCMLYLGACSDEKAALLQAIFNQPYAFGYIKKAFLGP